MTFFNILLGNFLSCILYFPPTHNFCCSTESSSEIKNSKKLLLFSLYLNKNNEVEYINSQAYNHKNIYERHNNLIKNKTNYSFQYVKSSKDYWENRYASGGNSGEGSYNKYAEFKASVLNNFVKEKKVNTIIEWGSGDCNQLSLSNYKNYIGYDVSITAINICKNKFLNDSSKMFIHINDNFINKKKADLSLSLDVIYHLIEDNIFNSYMKNLFTSSNKYVIISI